MRFVISKDTALAGMGARKTTKKKAAYKRGLKELFLLLRCRRITSAAAYPAASESREQLLQAWVPES